MSHFLLIAAVLSLAALPASLSAGTVFFDEDFDADPSGDWTLNGTATHDPGAGRAVMTVLGPFQAASMFFNQVIDVEDFRLEATVKLCCGSGADGMALTFIEGTEADATRIGDAGGGLCATNLTAGRQLVIEFDLWGNAGCEACDADPMTETAGNHVGVEYSATGFPPGDCLPGFADPGNVACAATEAIGFDLHGDYGIQIVAELEGGFIRVEIGSTDLGIDLHTVIEQQLGGFEPFSGLFGVTASTGGYDAEQSIYSVRLESLSGGGCAESAAAMARTLESGRTVRVETDEFAAYELGRAVPVSLEIAKVRGGAGCPAPTELTVEETLPDGWSATAISDGGTFAGGVVKWILRGGQIAPGKILHCDAIPEGKYREARFSGVLFESNVAGAPKARVSGDGRLLPISGPGIGQVDGAFHSWLLLGPYMHNGEWSMSEEAARRDYLTDGDAIAELDVMPMAGDEVATDYGNAAASTGLALAGNFEMNPNGFPQWFEWHDKDAMVDLGGQSIYGPVDNTMCYAVCYLDVEYDVTVSVNCGSDDGIQVLADAETVWINPALRPHTPFQDISAPFVLTGGLHRLMVKVFEAGGDWRLSLRLLDDGGLPLVEGVTALLTPDVAPPPGRFKRGDTNADGTLNVADVVYLLGYLFGKGKPPSCLDTADGNDDGTANVADAIAVLGHLFGHAGPLPNPFAACDRDPTADRLDCASFAPCR